jgi:hypothetical protein
MLIRDNQHEPGDSHLNYKLPISVSSTACSAFSDPFNWLMIVPLGALTVGAAIQLALSFQWIGILFFAIPASLLSLYTIAILNREIEISENGIRYREAFRILNLNWEEINAILIEPRWGQITFGITNNRVKRIHEIGLPRRPRKAAREILIQEAKIRGIKIFPS